MAINYGGGFLAKLLEYLSGNANPKNFGIANSEVRKLIALMRSRALKRSANPLAIRPNAPGAGMFKIPASMGIAEGEPYPPQGPMRPRPRSIQDVIFKPPMPIPSPMPPVTPIPSPKKPDAPLPFPTIGKVTK